MVWDENCVGTNGANNHCLQRDLATTGGHRHPVVWVDAVLFSQALAYVTPETISRERRDKPTNVFYFGKQKVTTRVWMMVPPQGDSLSIDVADYIWEKSS